MYCHIPSDYCHAWDELDLAYVGEMEHSEALSTDRTMPLGSRLGGLC